MERMLVTNFETVSVCGPFVIKVLWCSRKIHAYVYTLYVYTLYVYTLYVYVNNSAVRTVSLTVIYSVILFRLSVHSVIQSSGVHQCLVLQ